ncbi:hypothetical protein EST38_g11156 [Candolleomyces aberdarensis]|uniref:Uncharacterized protein n=1 Tax=Candolleomyces aberdarensis TaxID=2316362 RepID=A0A4Q2D7X1_9AGAR|nr:hypothetical protein EST38_g11156 [Candolleomyces aberdarensis]
MKLLSAVTIAATVVLLQNALSLVSALDMRFYTATNCAGGWLQCGNLPAGLCCYSPTVPAAALRLTSVAGIVDFSGWASQTCSGSLAVRASTTGCKPAAFAFTGHPTPASTCIVSRAPADCVEPDSFGFVDENCKEHIAKISEGNRKAVYGALGTGDVATLKVETAAVA